MKNPLPLIAEHPAQRELIVFLLILSVAFAVYWQSLSNGFLINWDDPNYIVNNLDAHGFSLEHLKNAFSRFYVGNYAPLQIVSYMLDYSFWGLKPSGYIFHNILLHALNGYLLYLLVKRVSSAFYPSILSAILFVVHPAQVESVVWMSQRKNLLAMFFFLLSIQFYLSYRDHVARNRALFYTLSLLFFVCALLAKSVAVVLPVWLVLYEICICNEGISRALKNKIPFIVMAFTIAMLAMMSQSEVHGGGGRTSFHGGSPYATFMTMMPVFVSYLRIIIFPAGLSGVYVPDIKTSLDSEVAAAGVIMLLLVFFARLIYSRDRKLFFWYAVGAISILPVSQVVPIVTIMNDRYLYFPMAGVAPFIVLGALKLLPADRGHLRYAAAGLLVFMLAVAGVMAAERGLVWKDSVSLWKDALRTNPKNNVAKYYLANVYSETGELNKLGQLLQELLAAEPDSAKTHELLGHYYYKSGELQHAGNSYKRALELNRNLSGSYFCLGNIYLGRNDLKSAEDHFSKAVKLGPMTPDLSYSIACLESLKGELPQALGYLDNAFKLGFRGCSAVRINQELEPLRTNQEYARIMKTYCFERGK